MLSRSSFHKIGRVTALPSGLVTFENKGVLNGPPMCSYFSSVPEPLESWISIMSDAVPFSKDTVVVCPSTFRGKPSDALKSRCQEVFPSAQISHLHPPAPRSPPEKDRSGLAQKVGLPDVLQEFSSTQGRLWTSPLDQLPPHSVDIVIYAANVFGKEMLFQYPSHITAAHRVLRKHGVLAIIGHAVDVKVVAPSWAREDVTDFFGYVNADCAEWESRSVTNQMCNEEKKALKERQSRLREGRILMESFSSAHADVYFPFPAVKRRWFESEYAVSPAEMEKLYQSLPAYGACYDASLMKHGDGRSVAAEQDFVSVGLPKSKDYKSRTPLVVCRPPHPLTTLLRYWELHKGLHQHERKLRARVLHFLVTCSSRSVDAVNSSAAFIQLPGNGSR